MKTTVDISDALLDEAKRIAAREGVTLRAMVELGLRRVIADKKRAPGRFRLRRASFRGEGLQPEIDRGSWDRIRAMAYEGRGG